MSEYLNLVISQQTVDLENTIIDKIGETFDYEALEPHKCTDEELGLDGSGNSKFYSINAE